MNDQDLISAFESEPKRANVQYKYGTAGFRMPNGDGELLCALLRCGALACVRSRTFGGKAVGIMITASHNCEPDNGAKLCDPDGGMLEERLEPVAEELANAADAAAALAVLRRIEEADVPVEQRSGAAVVLVARDTRASSEALRDAVLRGVAAAGGEARDYGVLTTPQLHFAVSELNEGRDGSEAAYNAQMANAFAALRPQNAPPVNVAVDCACGVGEPQLTKLCAALGDSVSLRAFNGVGSGALNVECGAEHVQKRLALPRGVADGDAGLFASLDGDADRVVFYGAAHGLELCDGDKIACLAADFAVRQLAALSLEPPASVGVVQTAYANGGAARFVDERLRAAAGGGVTREVVATGVKHLHRAAHRFDVGVYFEANGHGTVLFAPALRARLAALPPSAPRDALLAAAALANQAVGDALADLLLVVALLERRAAERGDAAADAGALLADWRGLYAELPSRQGKVSVADRTVIATTADETRCTAPAGLQDAIDDCVARIGGAARAFVRPSGTEDVVRTYAEADSRAKADELEALVAEAVRKHAGGI